VKQLDKRKRMEDKPLRATILEHMVHSERRLKVLGELFSRFRMDLYSYIKEAQKKKYR